MTNFVDFISIFFLVSFDIRFVSLAESKEITAESPRGGVEIKRVYGEWTTSYLLIRNANIADSGIYTCAPAGGSQTHIKVHVFLHGKCKNHCHSILEPFGGHSKIDYKIYYAIYIVDKFLSLSLNQTEWAQVSDQRQCKLVHPHILLTKATFGTHC